MSRLDSQQVASPELTLENVEARLRSVEARARFDPIVNLVVLRSYLSRPVSTITEAVGVVQLGTQPAHSILLQARITLEQGAWSTSGGGSQPQVRIENSRRSSLIQAQNDFAAVDYQEMTTLKDGDIVRPEPQAIRFAFEVFDPGLDVVITTKVVWHIHAIYALRVRTERRGAPRLETLRG